MSKQLSAAGIDVDYLFSGRAADKHYAMEPFGNWRCLEGLTFSVVKGKIDPVSTLLQAKPLQFLKDINSLPLADYDLIISDFEPVTAWAARRKKLACLGIGHQYAFNYPIPKAADNALSRYIMRQFAPTTYSLGMHWYHYQQPIVPPIVDTWKEENGSSNPNNIIVYLPFESDREVSALLHEFPHYHFLYYGAFSRKETVDNVTYNPVSREDFQRDLARSGGVICNAGFELASEAISLGKKVLVKPLQGQMEQISNALALEDLNLGRSTRKLTRAAIGDWLNNFEAKRVSYPDVAKYIVEWLLKGDLANKDLLVEEMWAQTDCHGLSSFQTYCKGRVSSTGASSAPCAR